MRAAKLITSVTQKGQATIPAKIREMLHIQPGDQIIFEISHGKVIVRKALAFDQEYHKAVSKTLSEWDSEDDDEAFHDL